jgi:hypothetical protein
MLEALSSYETPVLTRATQRNIQEDAILHSHCHENLKSFKILQVYSCDVQEYAQLIVSYGVQVLNKNE